MGKLSLEVFLKCAPRFDARPTVYDQKTIAMEFEIQYVLIIIVMFFLASFENMILGKDEK